MYVACFLLAMGGEVVSIYSTGRRASKKLLALIYKIIVMLCTNDDRIRVYNQETLEVVGFNGKVSELGSYPRSVFE